jgi:integrase
MSLFQPTYTDKKTGERIKSAVWWYEFVYDGRRIRESAKTSKKTIAGEAEKDHRRRLERARAGMPTEAPSRRIKTIGELLADYEGQYGVNHRPRAKRIVVYCNKHLVKAFGATLLPDVTAERVVAYMAQRVAAGASNRTINMEIAVLARAIGATWKALWPKLKKLEENQDVGRALETDEEARVVAAAAANRSPLIYPFVLMLVWTGVRSDEARLLRWSQIDWEAGEIVIGKAKTDAGSRRVIPMSGVLRAALERHAALCARQLGPIEPDWFVFPQSNRVRLISAAEPVGSLKTAWATVKTKAKVECRLHDLRHSFCTKLAEKGVPERTMLDMMGHVSAAMLRRYSHIRSQARRDAIAALEGKVFYGVLQESPKVPAEGTIERSPQVLLFHNAGT